MVATAKGMEKVHRVQDAVTAQSGRNRFFTFAAFAALLAMATNLLDVILGFGDTEVIVNGTQSATQWFLLFQDNGFKGLYTLGILNIVYMCCMLPVYFGVLMAHRRQTLVLAGTATLLFLLAFAIYVSNNAALPMWVLSGRYTSASTDAQRALLAAAGEAVLARGEDFTPGAFPGTFLSGIAALVLSMVMLRGVIFGKMTTWIGVLAFVFLSVFTVLATFVPDLYLDAFYFFAMIGGLLALTWFVLVARGFFKLSRSNPQWNGAVRQ